MTTPPPSAPPPPPRRRRWRRRLLVLLGVLVLVVALAPFALSLPFVREAVARRVGAAVGCPVTIGKAAAWWGRGIDLEDVVIQGAPGFDAPLATIERVHLGIDVPALLGGRVDADVRVEAPVVVLRRQADGRENTEGVLAPREEEPEETGTAPTLRVRLERGALRAEGPAGAPPAVLDGIHLDLTTSPDGGVALATGLVARAAGPDGGDVTIDASVVRDRAGRGPLRVEIPPLDLARLAELAHHLGATQGARGVLEAHLSGSLLEDDRLDGTLRVEARGLELASDTVAFSLARAEGVTTFARDGLMRTTGALEDVQVRETTGDRPRAFREPRVTLAVDARWDGDAGTLTVGEGEALRAGDAFLVLVTDPLVLRTGAARTLAGVVEVHADLARLAGLRPFVPALEHVEAGRVGLRVSGTAEAGLDVTLGGRVRDLRLAPGGLSPGGYAEPEATFTAHAVRPDGGVLALRLDEVRSRLLTVAPGAGGPIEVRLPEGGPAFGGSFSAGVDLAALGEAIGGALGLEAGDRLAGRATLDGETTGDDAAGSLVAHLAGTDVRLPARWAPSAGAERLDGRVALAWDAAHRTLRVERLAGFGLQVDVGADLLAEGGGVEHVTVALEADLARARGLLAGPLGLAPGDRLTGRLGADLEGAREDDGVRWRGDARLTGVRWQRPDGRVALDEPDASLHHDVLVADDGRARIDGLDVESGLAKGTATGWVRGGEGDATSMDVAVRVGGSATRLAALAAAFLGPDYDDLAAEGTYDAAVRVRGDTGGGGERLLVEGGRLTSGAWRTGGLAIETLELTAERARGEDPLALRLGGRVNGGRTDATMTLRPGPERTPFALTLHVKELDTSSLVGDRGVGRYLTWLLPALLPAGAEVPVLSGRLDADVPRLAADDLGGDLLVRTLTGEGSIHLTKGEIKDSTLFRVAAGPAGLGQAGQLLVKAVPEVGRVMTRLSRSLTFTEAMAAFTAGDRVLRLHDGLIDGEAARIVFDGTVGLADQRLDLRMPVTLKGDAGQELAKVLPDGTIPLGVRGTLEQPQAVPAIRPEDLARGALGGGLPSEAKDAVDRLRGLLGR